MARSTVSGIRRALRNICWPSDCYADKDILVQINLPTLPPRPGATVINQRPITKTGPDIFKIVSLVLPATSWKCGRLIHSLNHRAVICKKGVTLLTQ